MALVALLAYFGVFAGLLYWRTPRASSVDDLLVADRSLSATSLALTLGSAWVGAGTLFGGAGFGYRAGLPGLWRSAGLWAGIMVLVSVAARIRRTGHRTIPELLGVHYGDGARLGASAALVVACVTLAAFQFFAAGRFLELILGVHAAPAVLAAATGCTACVALGGMKAVSRIDRVNAGVILGGFGLGCAYLVTSGAAGRALSTLRPDQLTIFGSVSPGQAIGLAVATVFLVQCDAGAHQKLCSTNSERAATAGAAGWLGTAFVLELQILALSVIGLVSLPLLDAAESDTVVVRIASDVLPSVVGAALIAACIAIVMSAGTSFVLAAASSLNADLLRGVRRLHERERGLPAFRICSVAAGMTAALVAIVFPHILPRALGAYTLYAAAVTPALIGALTARNIPRAAGGASMVAGGAAAVIWEAAAAFHGSPPVGVHALPAALAASTATLLALARGARPG